MSGVKGTALESVVADVLRLVDEGRIPRDELEARLEREDLELLGSKLLPGFWYPLGSYGRLMQLLFEVDGGRRVEYLVERGRRAADRIRASGIYAQLGAGRETWGERIAHILASLGPVMYKDTRWSLELEPMRGGFRFRAEVEIPAEFPDVCRHPTQGFIDYLARLHASRPMRITSERPSPTRMVFYGDPIAPEGPPQKV
jgi:hypothetical protein